MNKKWVDTPLGDCVVFKSGGTPSKSNKAYWSGDIPWVSAKDMKQFRLHDAQDHVTPEALKSGSRLAKRGSVLLLVRGMTLHKDIPISIAMRDMAFNQDIKALVAKPAIDPTFLAYWLAGQKSSLLGHVDSAGHGTGRLNTDTLKAMRIQLPPISEQKRIAYILAALDEKIELNRKMNENLEQMAETMFKSWFVDFDPVQAKAAGRKPIGIDQATADLFPDCFVDSELGKIPKGWKVAPVGDTVECLGGATPSTTETKYWEGGIHHWTTPKDFSSLASPFLLDTDRKLTNAGIAKISSGLLPAGTLLLSSRAPIGYIAIATMPIAINQGFIAMKCNEDASNFFMLNWCKANMGEIESRATGTTFPEISKLNFRPIRVCLPSKELMSAFTSKVVPIYGKVVANLRQAKTLSTIRETILPGLLNGDISKPSKT